MTSRSERSWRGAPCGSWRAALLAAGALGMASVFAACELAVEVDIPDHDSRLVAHSFFAPDSAWTVRLSRSADIEGRDDVRKLAVADATVRIIHESGDFSVSLEHIGEGLYADRSASWIPGPNTDTDSPRWPGAHPISGDAYTLEAEAPGLPAIRAVNSIPAAKAGIEEIARLDDNSIGPFQFENYRVRIRIEDPPGTNYYKLELFQFLPAPTFIFPQEDPDTSSSFQEISFSGNESAFRYDDYAYFFDSPDVAGGDESFQGVLFSDELFDGETEFFEITFNSEPVSRSQSRYKLVLTALSEDYFLYHHTAFLQSESVNDLNIAAALLQTPPIHLHSNVNEGLGVFAGYAVHAFGFDREGNVWAGEDRPE